MLGALVAAMVVLGSATPAAALPILDPQQADGLAADLAEAAEVQGICYGWQVRVDDAAGTLSGVDMGSSRGVGTSAEDPSCPRWMVFEASVSYKSSSSESEDSASFAVWSNVAGAPSESDLRRVGVSGGALLGTADDMGIVNATLALPALAAELRLAPALPLERNTADIPAVDRPTGQPGSDWIRSYGKFLLLFGLFVVIGLAWAGWAWAADRYDWKTGDGDDE